MEPTIIELGAVCSDTDATLSYLKELGLLASTMMCTFCYKHMSWQKDKHHKVDQYLWRCTNSECRRTKSIRAGSFWEEKKIHLGTLMMIFYLFCKDVPGHTVLKMLDVCENTIYKWYNLYRGIMSRALLDDPVVLGGEDAVVEIRENQFGRKRKYNTKLTKGIKSVFVFGLIDRDTKKVLLFHTTYRSSDAILPMIMAHVEVGTTIVTDGFEFSDSLESSGYKYETLNQKGSLVRASLHTIEGFWGNTKSKFKTMHGVTKEQIGAHLDEVVFRWNHKEEDMFMLMCGLMSKYYPCDCSLPP